MRQHSGEPEGPLEEHRTPWALPICTCLPQTGQLPYSQQAHPSGTHPVPLP